VKHLDEEERILYHYGESDEAASTERHLAECARCREEMDALARLLDGVGGLDAPERDADYGSRVYEAIAPRLGRRRSSRAWMFGAAAAVILAATFLAGRLSTEWDGTWIRGDVPERILLVALADHFDRSEVLLLEVVNMNEKDGARERETARELVRESRLYRQTALAIGDVATTEALDELERLLLDVAHGAGTDEGLQPRIEERDVLFKIRILQSNVRHREADLRNS